MNERQLVVYNPLGGVKDADVQWWADWWRTLNHAEQRHLLARMNSNAVAVFMSDVNGDILRIVQKGWPT